MTKHALLPAVSSFIDDWLDVLNPSDGRRLASVARGGAQEVDLAVAAASTAFQTGPWGRMTAHDRGRVLWALADLIDERAGVFAQLDALDSGKSLPAASLIK